MTNDIEKIQTVDNTEHGLKLDSGILSYIRTGITNVKQALDALFSGKADISHTHSTSESWLSTIVNNLTTLINGKAASATTLAGYGITDAYTTTQVDTSLLGKANQKHITSNSVVNLDTELPTDHSIYLVHLTWSGSATTLGSAFTTSVSIVYNGCDEDTVINNYHTFLICRHNTICYIYYINPNSKADSSDIPTKTSDLTNDSGFLTSHQNISGKADKVSGATNGNFAALNSNGNLTDSGKKASDFVSKNEIKGITFHVIDTSTTINPADIADGFIHQLNNALGRTLSSILGGSGYIHYHQNAGSITDTAICVRVYAGTAPHYIVEIACAYTV